MKTYLLTILSSVFSFCAYAQKETLIIKAIRHPKEEIKCGLMTSAGKEIVPARYEYANRVFDGHYLIGLDGKYAVADSLMNAKSDFYNDYDIIDKGFSAHYFARAILDEQKRATFLNQAEVMAKKYKSFGNLIENSNNIASAVGIVYLPSNYKVESLREKYIVAVRGLNQNIDLYLMLK